MVTKNKKKFDKKALSIIEQIDLMVKRGVIINDKIKAEFFLNNNNYYRLAPYWKHLEKNKSHELKNEIMLEDIIDIYNADIVIRQILIQAIEKIEISFKTQLAYTLSNKYGPHFHLDKNIFLSAYSVLPFNSPPNYITTYDYLLKEYSKIPADVKTHYKSVYQEELPPIWVIIEFFSFGTIFKIFDHLKEKRDRIKIADHFTFYLEGFS